MQGLKIVGATIRLPRAAGALSLCVSLVAAGSACEEKKIQDRLYFDDLKPPLGVKATILSDESHNTKTLGQVVVVGEVEPDVDRDELDRLLKTFWRQLKARSGFSKGVADKIDLRLYPTGKGKAAGSDWLAQVVRLSQSEEPTFTNRQKAPLLKWATAVLGKQPQFTGELKPQILADPTTMEIEIKVPFVKNDGSGAYVDELSYTRVTTEFSSYVRALFDKIADLRKVTFEGVHQGKPMIRVWLTRSQYGELGLRQVEESLGAFQGKFIEMLLSKAIKPKAVEKKVNAQRRKVYRETFARLPKEQVELAKGLR